MKRIWFVGVLVASMVTFYDQAAAEGDAAKGKKLYNGFLQCYTCHSVETGVTKVGPSLAGLFGRKAGAAEGYDGYSEAMVNSGVVWTAETLDKFLADPQKFIPGNSMVMDGYYVVGQVTSAQYRADVIAYLKQVTTQ